MKAWLENYLNSPSGKRILERAVQEEREYINYPLPKYRYNAYDILEEDIKVVLSHPWPDARSPLFSNGYAWSNIQGLETKAAKQLIGRIEKNYYGSVAVKRDYDFSRWSSQGLFLPHQHLTARWADNQPSPNVGWDNMFWDCMKYLIMKPQPRAFIIVYKDTSEAWIDVMEKINRQYHNHLLLYSDYHGVFQYDINYFRTTNDFLGRHNMKGIDWER